MCTWVGLQDPSGSSGWPAWSGQLRRWQKVSYLGRDMCSRSCDHVKLEQPAETTAKLRHYSSAVDIGGGTTVCVDIRSFNIIGRCGRKRSEARLLSMVVAAEDSPAQTGPQCAGEWCVYPAPETARFLFSATIGAPSQVVLYLLNERPNECH